MGVIINEGWLVLSKGSDSMLVYFEECKVDWKTNPTSRHYSGPTHLRYTTKKQWYEFKVKNIWLTSHANFSSFIDYITDWHNNTPYTFTLKVIRNTSTDYIEWDGDNTEFVVSIKKDGLRDEEKVSPHDGSIYRIGMIIFEQCG
jgi:hypothetical protein